MSTAFCGGVACTWEELCGALSAGTMVISMKYGRVTADEDDAPSRAAAAELRRRFIEWFGTSKCGPIHDRHDGCQWVVEEASRIIFSVLEDDWTEKAAGEK